MLKLKKKYVIVFFISVLLIGVFIAKSNNSSISSDKFELSKVKKSNLAYEVTATGTINPINTVTVGTQVSGIVEKVLVDYNDDVSVGQVLALLDSTTLKENMEKSYASYELSLAKESKAKLNYERIKK